MKNREEIKSVYKWDFSDIYKNREEFNKDKQYLQDNIDTLAKYKGKLNDKKMLLKYLEENNQYEIISTKIFSYLSLELRVNLINNEMEEEENILTDILTKQSVSTIFFNNEILSLKKEYIDEIIADKDFKAYANYLKDIIKYKDHILSEKEEKIITLSYKALNQESETYYKATNVDMKFEDVEDSNKIKHPLNTSTFSKYLESDDRVLRKNAYNNFYAGYKNFYNTISSLYLSNLRASNFISEVRNFDSTMQSNLFSDDIDISLYETLIENVDKNIYLIKKYYNLRKKYYNIDKQYFYDIYTNLSTSNIVYPFEKGLELVQLSTLPIGLEYSKKIGNSYKNKWIDIYPNKNKESGAFNLGLYDNHPFVLTNYKDTRNSVFTLAHELGHAMNSYYSNEKQPFSTFHVETFTAEVASTTNEVLLLKYLYNISTDRMQKLELLDEYIKMFKSTIFRQTMFSEFEKHAHSLVEKNKPISEKILTSYYKELLKKHFGDEVEMDDNIAIEWTRIPHFYNPFYVYKYATGFISAICIASNLMSEKEGQRKKYIEFLGNGSCDTPIKLLQNVGVDLLTSTPYDIAFSELKWALEEFEKTIEEIR